MLTSKTYLRCVEGALEEKEKWDVRCALERVTQASQHLMEIGKEHNIEKANHIPTLSDSYSFQLYLLFSNRNKRTNWLCTWSFCFDCDGSPQCLPLRIENCLFRRCPDFQCSLLSDISGCRAALSVETPWSGRTTPPPPPLGNPLKF